MGRLAEFVGSRVIATERWLRAAKSSRNTRLYHRTLKGVGANVRFNGISTFTGLEAAVLGDNVHIGDNAFIRAEGGLTIGDNTHISRNLVLYTFSHQYEGMALPYDDTLRPLPVTIGRNVWIGMNVVILPGAVIGDGAIIGAGAAVHGEVPACAIFAAAPGRVVGTRDQERYHALDREGRYGGVDGRPLQP